MNYWLERIAFHAATTWEMGIIQIILLGLILWRVW